MRWLIDGYNVMHAGGRLGPKLSRDGFRRARRRFLDELAAALGPELAGQSTVVFDASVHPGDFALDANYRGLGVLFALGDENADARIELLIAGDSNPRMLTVVSSDRRIREAARRRKSKSKTADDYWEWIDALKERGRKRPLVEAPLQPTGREQVGQRAINDATHWLETFRDVDDIPGIQAALAPNHAMLSDAEIAEIERQVERES
jgi:predicted RNA-binding protein with PIN domain